MREYNQQGERPKSLAEQAKRLLRLSPIPPLTSINSHPALQLFDLKA